MWLFYQFFFQSHRLFKVGNVDSWEFKTCRIRSLSNVNAAKSTSLLARWSCLFCWLLAWRFQSWDILVMFTYMCVRLLFSLRALQSLAGCHGTARDVKMRYTFFFSFFLLCALSTNPCTSQRFSLLSLLLCFCFFALLPVVARQGNHDYFVLLLRLR